jgi:hypothetical protein
MLERRAEMPTLNDGQRKMILCVNSAHLNMEVGRE